MSIPDTQVSALKTKSAMATLSLTLFKAKVLKDGRHKIRIAIRHRHETCYIVTRHIVEESQFRDGRVVRHPDASAINSSLRRLLNEYQERLDGMTNLSAYTCRQVKDILTQAKVASGHSTFSSVVKEYVDGFRDEGRNSYATLVERSARYFMEFSRGDIILSDITPQTVQLFMSWLKKNGKGDTYISTIIAHIRAVINRAVGDQFVKYDINPFVSCRLVQAPVREIDLSVDEMNKIRNAVFSTKKLNMARDLFMLSFYLGGMNLIDIMNYDFRGEDRVEYIRAKSQGRTSGENVTSVAIHPLAKEIIGRWMDGKTGRLEFGYHYTYHNFSQYVGYCIREIADMLNIKSRVCYYSARKTFAQFASDLGIPDGVIDYCLGHSDKKKGIIRYYTKVRQKQADIAVERVIGYLEEPERYKEYIELKQDIMLSRV